MGTANTRMTLVVVFAYMAVGCVMESDDWLHDEDEVSAQEAAIPGGELEGDDLSDKCAPTVLFEDDFADNQAGWTLDEGWQIGAATTSSCQIIGSPDPTLDYTPTSDNNLAGVLLGGCPSITASSPFRYMTSPVIDTDVPGAVSLTFGRWLNTSYRNPSHIEVFDGSSWVLLYQAFPPAAAVSDSTWTEVSYDLTPYKNPNLQVRFGYRVRIWFGGWVMSSWNIDDVQVAADTCE